jgi:hypothetical protein
MCLVRVRSPTAQDAPIRPDNGSRQEEQGMPTPHDDLLTPTEHEAAQLLVTLAWRLDGGQLVSADQLLARLCAIPTMLQRPSVEILDHLRAWLAGRAGVSG